MVKHKHVAVRSKDLKTWEDISETVSFPKGMLHGTAFRVSEEIINQLLANKIN